MAERGEEAAAGRARYRFRFGRLHRLLLLWGVRPRNAWVDLDGSSISARFGPWRITVALANVAAYELTGPYRWWRAIGVRRSIRGGDVTFGSSADDGICLRFVRPVQWLRVFRPPALTLTLEDPDGFAAALRARGINGQDHRNR